MNLKFAVLKLTGWSKIIPPPVKSILRFFRLHQALDFLANKYTAEWRFQAEWAEEFKNNRHKVLEYWKKYRHFDDIQSLCSISETDITLDVGCGISTILHFISGKKYGVDPLAEEYKKLYTYPNNITIQKALGEKLPFTNLYFDNIFCTNVLDHVTNPKETLGEIHRTLKTAGNFILTVEVFTEKIERDHAHPHCLTKKEVDNLLQGKFKIVFEAESPWIGMRNYVNGKKGTSNKELIRILKKI